MSLTRPEARTEPITVLLSERRQPVSPCLEDAIRQIEGILDSYDDKFKLGALRPAVRSGESNGTR